ncbi:MAG: polysaccharide deacetylase family protein [Acidilobaceae archaeon]|nr:polysaccharide deacetylase family protein [Acidilobaceae archaeon]MDW7974305.1 polysaccharide deacetylase family protein [Sulfolobales archaeon]
MRVALTFDVEMDAPPYLSSWRGVDEGLPIILEALREKGVRATFFTIGILGQLRPKAVYSIVEEGHELGCHGYDHKRLDKLPLREAADNVRKCIRTLRDFADVETFRAPNLKLPPPLLHVLREEGVRLDSSVAWYKPPFRFAPTVEAGVLRVPASYPSSVLRLPWTLLKALFPPGREYVVITHPWEYVELVAHPRPDLTIGVGRRVAENLSRLIEHLKGLGYELVTMRDHITRG